jgi:hypothetical protein
MQLPVLSCFLNIVLLSSAPASPEPMLPVPCCRTTHDAPASWIWDSLAPGASLPFAWDDITAKHVVEVVAEVLAPGGRATDDVLRTRRNVDYFEIDTLQVSGTLWGCYGCCCMTHPRNVCLSYNCIIVACLCCDQRASRGLLDDAQLKAPELLLLSLCAPSETPSDRDPGRHPQHWQQQQQQSTLSGSSSGCLRLGPSSSGCTVCRQHHLLWQWHAFGRPCGCACQPQERFAAGADCSRGWPALEPHGRWTGWVCQSAERCRGKSAAAAAQYGYPWQRQRQLLLARGSGCRPPAAAAAAAGELHWSR